MKVVIIDFKAGNITSVVMACNCLGFNSIVSQKPDEILKADRIIFPGVGAARSAMENLKKLGLIEILHKVIKSGKPFLGICVGTQILFDYSEEDGGTECLGELKGKVVKFSPSEKSEKVPHMGWNNVLQLTPHPIFNNIPDLVDFYFVHSYYVVPVDFSIVIGTTKYAGVSFPSVITYQNIVATQFHPEKSGKYGLKLLENFLTWQP